MVSCASAGVVSRVTAASAASAQRRDMFIVWFPPRFLLFCLLVVFAEAADLRDFGRVLFDEAHGDVEVLCQRIDGGIGVASQHRRDDGGMLGLDVARLADVADRQPAIALALLMQHVAKTEQPWRAAGIDQRAMEDAMVHHPLLVMHAGLVG